MPSTYGKVHNGFIEKYNQTQKGTMINYEWDTPVINKQGYLVMCKLLIKNVPSLLHGIQFIGFLR